MCSSDLAIVRDVFGGEVFLARTSQGDFSRANFVAVVRSTHGAATR